MAISFLFINFVFTSTSFGISTPSVSFTLSGKISNVSPMSNSTIYYITSTSDNNSVISPSGVSVVSAGSPQTYSMSASEGYSISSVLVDGINLGPITNYTFTAVDNNHTISVFSVFTSTSELKTTIIIYGTATLNSAQQANVANTFDLMVCDAEMTDSTLAGIKAVNPDIIILKYINILATSPSIQGMSDWWSEVDAHEDWFMHNNAGNRIINTYWWGWYLMDIRSGWRDYYVQRANKILSSPYVDGIYGDDILNEIRWTIEAGVFSDAITNTVLGQSDFPSPYLDNWKNDMITFLNYVKSNMTQNKIFVINSEERTTNVYLVNTNVDGKMCEGFGGQTTESGVLQMIDEMVRDSATGKIFMAAGTAGWEPYSQSSHSPEFCYTAALLGCNGGDNCYFGYNFGEYYGYDQGANYLPTLAPNLGSPKGSYYKNQSVYQRDFTNGKVLLNPSDSIYSVDLGGNYQLLNGTIVTSITLEPWSGEVLSYNV